MNSNEIPYEKQIFVCTNDRKGEKPSCGDHQGEAVFQELRRIAKERGLHPKIRVAQAKCLGQCSIGVNIMVYPAGHPTDARRGSPENECEGRPDGIWHSGVRLEDVPQLAEKYLLEKK